ncbi:MAG TPA: TadE/TadG family type IV pilus assembly protein [Candidatus Acidoferrales bacterium]|nr:TadE/TadG family type IV pilus assembly protein [Candidatus Acidoferrales bacterium]
MQQARSNRGQGMVEFAIVSVVAFAVIFGIIDFSVLFAGRIMSTNAARNAVRYAATHPTAWSNAAQPADDSIEGKLVSAAVPAIIVNDDAHVTISYVVPGPGPGTTCGQYSAASNSFVPVTGFTQATCVVAGSLIRIHVTYIYAFATPVNALLGLSSNPVTLVGEAAELEEQ